MEPHVISYIKNNPLIYSYLRENSYWYKELNRNSNVIKQVEEAARKYYKQTPQDKLEKISKNIEFISTFMDVLK